MSERDDSEPVPKLPRGRGLKLTGPEVFRVLITATMLIVVLILAKPCGEAVSKFVMGMDGSGKGSALPTPGKLEVPQLPGSAGDYVELHPGMTDEEVRQAIEQAKAKQRERQAASGSAASGSATPAAGSSAPSATRSSAPGATGSAASSAR